MFRGPRAATGTAEQRSALTFVPVPEPRKGRRKHLTMEEWQRLLREARADTLRSHVLIQLMYSRALRAGEVGLLRLDHCKRLHLLQLWVPREKGSNNQWHVLEHETALMLRAWIEVTFPHAHQRVPQAFLFPGYRHRGRAARGLSRHAVLRLVRLLGQRAGIPEELQHPHAIRHARAQHLYEEADKQGLPVDVMLVSVGKITGHKTAFTSLKHYLAETGQGARIADIVLQRALGGRDDGDDGD